MYQEYGRTISQSCVKCCLIQRFHQSQHNRWTSWTMLFCFRLLSFSKTCLKEMWNRLGKERGREDPEISYPSMAGRGVEEAVWTLRETDGGAQSQRPTVLLQIPQDGACHVWQAGAESGTKDWEANRDVPTAFEPHSSGYRKFRTAFKVHSSWILLILE